MRTIRETCSLANAFNLVIMIKAASAKSKITQEKRIVTHLPKHQGLPDKEIINWV
ncbi:hypothetical protein MASR2M41_22810 [Flammeovirgaceae bacterium]